LNEKGKVQLALKKNRPKKKELIWTKKNGVQRAKREGNGHFCLLREGSAYPTEREKETAKKKIPKGKRGAGRGGGDENHGVFRRETAVLRGFRKTMIEKKKGGGKVGSAKNGQW